MINQIDEVEFVLDKIKFLWEWVEEHNNADRIPTHRNIWQGSYDVWSCDQDKMDAMTIPPARMKDAEDRGFIKSESYQRGKHTDTVWILTESGEEKLKELRELRKQNNANRSN